jgi:predicted O-methyltransferase YrrM
MDPNLCKMLNHLSLEQLSGYLNISIEKIEDYYKELLEDEEFLKEINEQIQSSRKFYQNAIFKHEELDSIDWMAIQRIILYILVRLFKPEVCVETGVFYGGNSCFILNALRRNNFGELISIDLPSSEINSEERHFLVGDQEDVPKELDAGFLIHESLKKRWKFIQGDSLKEIPKIEKKIDLYIHDSEHSFQFIKKEMSLIWNKLKRDAIIVADDLDWSNGFFSFCVERKIYPLIITDNGNQDYAQEQE